jgi:hypothetical protein
MNVESQDCPRRTAHNRTIVRRITSKWAPATLNSVSATDARRTPGAVAQSGAANSFMPPA